MPALQREVLVLWANPDGKPALASQTPASLMLRNAISDGVQAAFACLELRELTS